MRINKTKSTVRNKGPRKKRKRRGRKEKKTKLTRTHTCTETLI